MALPTIQICKHSFIDFYSSGKSFGNKDYKEDCEG